MSAPNSNSTTNASSASRNPEPCAEPALSESAQAGESNGCPVQTAVMGVSGYAGMELARLLLRHPSLAGSPPLFLGRPDSTPEPLAAVHPQLMDNNGTGLGAGGVIDRAVLLGLTARLAASRSFSLPHPTSSRASGCRRRSITACASSTSAAHGV